MPNQCIQLYDHIKGGAQFIFANDSAAPWLFIILYLVVFLLPTFYVYRNRKEPSIQTRSPKLIIAGFIFMMFDCILNTNLLSKSPRQVSPWAFQCDLQIIITVVMFFGGMMCYYARMWRVYKVFSLY